VVIICTTSFNVNKTPYFAHTAYVHLFVINKVPRHEHIWKTGGIDPRILNLALETSNQLHALAELPQEKEPSVAIRQEMGGPQSRCGYFGEDKNLLPLPEIEPRFVDRPACS
jgi:hypothetical protein